MIYVPRPWKGRKPRWAQEAEMLAERLWEIDYAPADEVPPPHDADPANTGWNEPGGASAMMTTATQMEKLAEYKAQYILDAYARAVADGIAEEYPAYLLPPPLGTRPE